MEFTSTTPTTLSLQARDWYLLGFIMKGDERYENLSLVLKNQFQVQNPPTGKTLVQVTNQPLGELLQLFYQVHDRYGKEVGKATRNRFRIVLETLATQEITDWLTALDAEDLLQENNRQETGRKWLRGRLG
jgi:hypothetical protein